MESQSNRLEVDDWDKKVFQSTYVHSGEYSLSRRTLRLYYHASRVPAEYAAPPEIWAEMKAAHSAGTYARRIVQPNFLRKDKKK